MPPRIPFPPPPPRASRRVVVTGLGLVTPLAVGVQASWTRLLAGECGLHAWAGDPSFVVAAVPRGPGAHEWDAARHVPRGEARTMSPDFIAFALAAAGEALHDAGLLPGAALEGGGCAGAPNGCAVGADGLVGPYTPARAGVAIGSGIGAVEEVGEAAVALSRGERVSPFFVPRILLNMAAGSAAVRFGLRGPCAAPATACASGAHAISDAFRAVQGGAADVMLAGGTEAALGRTALAGFARLRALSTRHGGAPERASRPFDASRDGFVMGEGAGLLVLESLDGALARGARIYGELRGAGLSSDAHHATHPRPDGSGAASCMASALADGGLRAADVGYVNAHATGTPAGDGIEALGIARAWGWHNAGAGGGPTVAVSSTKGSIGHLLGAAGAVEAAFSLLALHTGVLPRGRNLDALDPAIGHLSADMGGPLEFLGLRGGTELPRDPVRAVLSNSFGFGGANVSLLFSALTALVEG